MKRLANLIGAGLALIQSASMQPPPYAYCHLERTLHAQYEGDAIRKESSNQRLYHRLSQREHHYRDKKDIISYAYWLSDKEVMVLDDLLDRLDAGFKVPIDHFQEVGGIITGDYEVIPLENQAADKTHTYLVPKIHQDYLFMYHIHPGRSTGPSYGVRGNTDTNLAFCELAQRGWTSHLIITPLDHGYVNVDYMGGLEFTGSMDDVHIVDLGTYQWYPWDPFVTYSN